MSESTAIRSLIATALGAAFLLFLIGRPHHILAQEVARSNEAAKSSSKARLVALGKYIVEGVAGCGYRHRSTCAKVGNQCTPTSRVAAAERCRDH
jgi:hypothetical protein